MVAKHQTGDHCPAEPVVRCVSADCCENGCRVERGLVPFAGRWSTDESDRAPHSNSMGGGKEMNGWHIVAIVVLAGAVIWGFRHA